MSKIEVIRGDDITINATFKDDNGDVELLLEGIPHIWNGGKNALSRQTEKGLQATYGKGGGMHPGIPPRLPACCIANRRKVQADRQRGPLSALPCDCQGHRQGRRTKVQEI